MSQLKFIDTGNKWGNMNTAPRFYPANLPREYRQGDFLTRRIILGNELGFDGHKVFMADQEDKTGSYHILTDKDVKNAPNGWSAIPQDILILTDRWSGIVGGHPVADCPVVILEDQKNDIAALAHCSGELIDMRMPMLARDALYKAGKELGVDIQDEDVSAYVSACAGANWTYDSMPKWATDQQVWKHSIYESAPGVYNINLRTAVLEQLAQCNLHDAKFVLVDTITHPDYYSNSAARQDKSKAGRQFIGAFYPDPYFKPVRHVYSK